MEWLTFLDDELTFASGSVSFFFFIKTGECVDKRREAGRQLELLSVDSLGCVDTEYDLFPPGFVSLTHTHSHTNTHTHTSRQSCPLGQPCQE